MSKFWILVVLLTVLVLVGCAKKVEVVKEVPKEVTRIVTREVITKERCTPEVVEKEVTRVVEKEVERLITNTPLPPTITPEPTSTFLPTKEIPKTRPLRVVIKGLDCQKLGDLTLKTYDRNNVLLEEFDGLVADKKWEIPINTYSIELFGRNPKIWDEKTTRLGTPKPKGTVVVNLNEITFDFVDVEKPEKTSESRPIR